ncbi:hypothetical protein ACI3KX_12980 [Microbacterium sp. ZW CA_36]|uniref:hypothetical protein n=1 Tax=Microbacterium sp. ZW CA_36 TaxID=3378078 RepID=UPI003854D65B
MRSSLLRKTPAVLASATLGLALLLGPVAPATAAVTIAPATFNPDACVVKLGWNNTFKYINGVKYQRYGAFNGVNQCPREEWRIPGSGGGGM